MIDNDLEYMFKDRVIQFCNQIRVFPLQHWLLQCNELLQEIFTVMIDLHQKGGNKQDHNTVSFIFDRQFIKNDKLKQMMKDYRELAEIRGFNKAFRLLTKNVENRFFNGIHCDTPIIVMLLAILNYEGRKIYFDTENSKENENIINFFNDIEFYTFLYKELNVERMFYTLLPADTDNIITPKVQKKKKAYTPINDKKKAYYLSIAERYNKLICNMNVSDAKKIVFKEFKIKQSTLRNSLIHSKL